MKGLLLSGGMDSAALAYLIKPNYAFNIDYGQRAAQAERRASKALCEALNIELIEIDIDCTSIGSGDLVGTSAIAVAAESDWWPFRNQLLITLCATKALELRCSQIFIGAVASDGYHKDGTREFIKKINELVSYQEGGISIVAPGLNLTTTELINESGIPFDLLAWSHSCHKSDVPCTNCRGCNKHYTIMHELGVYG